MQTDDDLLTRRAEDLGWRTRDSATPPSLAFKLEMALAAIVVGIGPVLWAFGTLRSVGRWLWG